MLDHAQSIFQAIHNTFRHQCGGLLETVVVSWTFQGYQSNQYTAGENAVPIKKFASILTKQLLTYAELLRTYPLPSSSVPCTVVTASSEDPTSSLETSANGSAHPLIDKNGFSHCPILFEKCPKNKRVKPRHCSYCSVPGQPNPEVGRAITVITV